MHKVMHIDGYQAVVACRRLQQKRLMSLEPLRGLENGAWEEPTSREPMATVLHHPCFSCVPLPSALHYLIPPEAISTLRSAPHFLPLTIIIILSISDLLHNPHRGLNQCTIQFTDLDQLFETIAPSIT